MPGDEQEEDEAEPPADSRDSPQMTQVCVSSIRQHKKSGFLLTFCFCMRQYYLLSQAGTPDASAEQRESENGGLKRELEVLKPELQLVRAEVSSATLVLRSSDQHLQRHLCLRLRLSGV